jgi:hypothetical protein
VIVLNRQDFGENEMLKKVQNLTVLEKVISIAAITTILIIAIHSLLKIIPPPAIFLIAFLLFSILILLGLYLKSYFDLVNKQKKLAKEYEAAKNMLRKNPKNSQFREAVLSAGRKYYSSLRDGVYVDGILTIYDEQAISNDLNTIIGSNPNNN